MSNLFIVRCEHCGHVWKTSNKNEQCPNCSVNATILRATKKEHTLELRDVAIIKDKRTNANQIKKLKMI